MSVPYIKSVGEFRVTIKAPRWEELEAKAGDENRMALVLPCYTEPDDQFPEGQRMDFHLNFTGTLVKSGARAGRPQWQCAMEDAVALGMNSPFSPEKIDELDGVAAVLTTKEDTYNGKTRVVPQFLNPERRAPLSKVAAADKWARMTGGMAKKPITPPATAQAAAPATAAGTTDDIPF